MSTSLVIPTDGGLRPRSPKWQPMVDWLTANRFNVNSVPTDALIEIRDGSCLGVELYDLDADGRIRWPNTSERPPTHIEWHPMTQAPPAILLPTGRQP